MDIDEKYGWGCVITIALILLLAGVAGGTGIGCALWRNADKASQEKEKIQDKSNQSDTSQADQKELNDLKDKVKLLEQRNKINGEILTKWRLPIPSDEELEKFDIMTYFCETWCPWIKNDLPKVRKDYKESDCSSCDPPKQTTHTHRRTGCRNCQPPSKVEVFQPPPIPTEPTITTQPGPTANCP